MCCDVSSEKCYSMIKMLFWLIVFHNVCIVIDEMTCQIPQRFSGRLQSRMSFRTIIRPAPQEGVNRKERQVTGIGIQKAFRIRILINITQPRFNHLLLHAGKKKCRMYDAL